MSGWAAAASAGAGALGQLQSFGLNKMAASQSWDRQKNLMTRGPTYVMSGLRKAGLNPILAAGNLGTSARAPQAAPSANTARADVLTGNKSKLLNAQTSAAGAQQNKLAQEAWLAKINHELLELDVPRRKALAELYSSEYGIKLLEAQELNAALPNTAAGILTKGTVGIVDRLREAFELRIKSRTPIHKKLVPPPYTPNNYDDTGRRKK